MTDPSTRESANSRPLAADQVVPSHVAASRWMLAVRVPAFLLGAALASCGALVALNRAVFHGFSPNCSDGYPFYDPQSCGITWQAGFSALALAALGALAVAVSAWNRALTSGLLVAIGSATALLALFLLWTGTWDPVTPAYPEPAAPQYVLLAVGAALALVGCAIRRAPGPMRRSR